MGNDIQDLWIMQEQGIVLYKYIKNEKIDDQIFGGFMAAINSFAGIFSKTGLDSFELGDRRFFFLKQDGLIFIANAKNKIKPQKMEKIIKENANKFVKTYNLDIIKRWNGDLSFFHDVKPQKVEKDIQNNVTKFMQKYPSTILKNWNGDLTFFDDFKGDF